MVGRLVSEAARFARAKALNGLGERFVDELQPGDIVPAAISTAEGGFPFPERKPPYPAQSAVHGATTLINNVDTLAHLPHILHDGSGGTGIRREVKPPEPRSSPCRGMCFTRGPELPKGSSGRG
jgi:hypothetical protein